MNNSNQKRQGGRFNGGPRREHRSNRPAEYFERRFMTDEEHDKFRKHLLEKGIIKENVPPKYLSKEEVAELKERMIANGTLIPLAKRKNIPKEQLGYIYRAQNAARFSRAGNA